MENDSEWQAYEASESLWSIIKQNVNESELDAIKSAIGESLIDTTLELHNEIETLLEIWRDYREETTQNINKVRNSISNKALLPEPPDMRERLIKEITFFVKQMRLEKAENEAQFQRQLINNNHNLEIIHYALNNTPEFADTSQLNTRTKTSLTRPLSSLSSRSGLETPIMSNRLKSEKSTYSTKINESLENFETKLNCIQIDEIVESLRDKFEDEKQNLLKDIEFLYECIDKESEYRDDVKRGIKEPTINELKEERKKLENDLLSNGTSLSRISRPSSNNSISSINFSIKSPSPTPSSRLNSPNTTRIPPKLQTGLISDRRSISVKSLIPSNRDIETKIHIVPNINNNKTPLKAAEPFKTGLSTTRTNSVASALSNQSSLLSQATATSSSRLAARQNAAARFRKMVLDSRDSP